MSIFSIINLYTRHFTSSHTEHMCISDLLPDRKLCFARIVAKFHLANGKSHWDDTPYSIVVIMQRYVRLAKEV